MAKRVAVGAEPHTVQVAGETILCDSSGVLYHPDADLLIVSDLHLEKGAAFARRGSFLPPYDTGATLGLLEQAIGRFQPQRVVCLGDSFHDRKGAELMPTVFREMLAALMACRDWLWIAGNHDPLPPGNIGGDTAKTWQVGGLRLRHEPTPQPSSGEIAGHLHPVACVSGGGRSRRGACFASDGERLIMPSFGVTTGGLNVLDRAFDGLFDVTKATAYVIGLSRIYPISFRALSR